MSAPYNGALVVTALQNARSGTRSLHCPGRKGHGQSGRSAGWVMCSWGEPAGSESMQSTARAPGSAPLHAHPAPPRADRPPPRAGQGNAVPPQALQSSWCTRDASDSPDFHSQELSSEVAVMQHSSAPSQAIPRVPRQHHHPRTSASCSRRSAQPRRLRCGRRAGAPQCGAVRAGTTLHATGRVRAPRPLGGRCASL